MRALCRREDSLHHDLGQASAAQIVGSQVRIFEHVVEECDGPFVVCVERGRNPLDVGDVRQAVGIGLACVRPDGEGMNVFKRWMSG